MQTQFCAIATAIGALVLTAQPCLSETAAPAAVSTPFAAPRVEPPRPMAFISDLHFGLGQKPDGQWFAQEDFRWPRALAGFLDALSTWSSDRVDLVIVGDFLELWQPPADVKCPNLPADRGCSVAQMLKITETVVAAHRDDLALLRDFSKRGDNRLHIIPGNHDSALLIPQVFAPLGEALDAKSGRIAFVTSGFWKSPDGRVVAEHGHQVGSDVNRYEKWPRVTRQSGSENHMIRPWGERFVQKLFNEQEEQYEIIDNVAPETVGVKYRIADRGYALSAIDVAEFLQFHLYQTSLMQKARALGSEKGAGADDDRQRWNLTRARELGYRLFTEALPKTDPLRREIEGADAQSQSLKAEFDKLAKDPARLPDDDVRLICEHLSAAESASKCEIAAAGATAETLFFPRRYVMRGHIADHLKSDPRVRIFVYGHTHALEEKWELQIDSTTTVSIHNTGAFQRTVDEAGFKKRAADKKLSDQDALRGIKLEDLPACYSVVLVQYEGSLPKSRTMRWHMPEDAAGTMVEPGVSRCD